MRILGREVGRMEAVLECHGMTGQTDEQLRVVAATLDDYERFIRTRRQRVGGIGSIDTSFADGTMKHSEVFPAQ